MISSRLLVPAKAWVATLDAFAGYAERGVEGGCLWYANSREPQPKVTLIGIPRQINRPRNFEIPADALEELNRAVPDGLTVVAQIHTHPGRETRQSPWDDRLIVSRKIWSLVVPHYGRRPCGLPDCGAHAFLDGRWRLLPREEAGRRVALAIDSDSPSPVIDLR